MGARLLYEDDTIQHAGVVIGFGGVAGHTFIGLHEAENSYFHRAMCAQDYSAVTAACLMVKKSVFEEVGGLTEELAVLSMMWFLLKGAQRPVIWWFTRRTR